jgi:ATP-dependent DNA helicase RecQ
LGVLSYFEPVNAAGILKKYWGHDQFRPPQAEVIEAVLRREDTLVLLPTGGGKSVCFQVPALLLEGVCLVVTPLIALMLDQVQQLKSKGIKATAVHAGLTREEIDIALDNCVYGAEKFLYLSPERLQTEIFQERVRKMNVSLVAVDEAHCISQWGYDFRPSYLQIAALRDLKPGVSFVALTASATKIVRDDIINQLKLDRPAIFQASLARPNLSFVVRKTENKEKQLLNILKRVPGSSIIYVRSRRATQEYARFLSSQKIKASYYHAGLPHEERKARQLDWIANKVRVIVATNAFGMGINKPDVRTVVHMDLPENLESYYQEAGRAGRDGASAYATVIYHATDVATLEQNVLKSHPGLEFLKRVYQGLANYYQLALGSFLDEKNDFDLESFCARFGFKSSETIVALKKLEEEGLIELSDSFYRTARLHFSSDKKKIYEFQVAHVRYDGFLKTLLRLYGGELFSDFVAISESQLARAMKWKEKEVRDELQNLHQLQVVNYQPASDSPTITFTLPRQDPDHLPVNVKKLAERRDLGLQKMRDMIAYVEQNHRCRTQVIQEYFDETTYTTCGICDVCIEKKKADNRAAFEDYEGQVLHLLRQKPMTVDELEESILPEERDLFLDVIRELVDRSVIAYDEFWVLQVKGTP